MTIVRDIVMHPANQRRRLAALVQAARWQLHKRIFRQPLDFPYHGLKLRCYPDNHSASRAIYFGGLPDYSEMRFMIDFLRPGDRFVDAGANVGIYTLLAASLVGKTGKVDAFEPQKKMVNMLLENVRLNNLNNVEVHPIGLSDVVGVVDMVDTGDDCSGYVAEHTESRASHGGIEVRRLDESIEHVVYSMAKFDIEGFEPYAIRGASELIRKRLLPVMIVEMAGYSNRHGISTPDFIAELKEFGYFTAVYCPERRLLQKTDRPWEVPTENVLAILEEQAEMVVGRLHADHLKVLQSDVDCGTSIAIRSSVQ